VKSRWRRRLSHWFRRNKARLFLWLSSFDKCEACGDPASDTCEVCDARLCDLHTHYNHTHEFCTECYSLSQIKEANPI
jgi:hypothetical protein